MDRYKLKRNNFCSCGSNLKYKKCCLKLLHKPKTPPEDFKTGTEEINGLVQYGKLKLILYYPFHFIKEFFASRKMPKIILDLVRDYLEVEGENAKKSVISFGCMAWNLSFIKEDSILQSEIKRLLSKFKLSVAEEKEGINIILKLIDKKREKYPNINRYIISYHIMYKKNNLKLKIASLVRE